MQNAKNLTEFDLPYKFFNLDNLLTQFYGTKKSKIITETVLHGISRLP